MRKKISFLLLGTIILSVVLYLQINIDSPTGTVPVGTLHWVRDQSYCLDISVQHDRVYLTYSFHFENTSDNDYWVCYPQAKFSRIELFGWMEYDNFSGYGENGEKTFLVPANDDVDIIVTFEGNYLGGRVNDKISTPSIVFLQKQNTPDYS